MSEFSLSKQDMAELKRLASTDAGRQLMAYLRQNSGRRLQSAIEQAAAGNLEEAKAMAKDLMNSPETRSLLEELRRMQHGGY